MPEFRRRPIVRLLTAIALAAPALTSASSARAQDPVLGQFALDRYEPTPAGDRFFAIPSGAVDGESVLRLSLTFDYAKDPLVLRDTCNDANKDGTFTAAECNLDDTKSLGSVVSDQLIAHIGVSYALWEHLLLSL